MPQLGESIAEATVVSIEIAEGDDLAPDQEVIQVETDKATMGVTVQVGGKVIELTAEIDRSYPVGATLGFMEVTEDDAATAGFGEEPEAAPAAAEPAEDSSAEDDLAGVHFKVDESQTIRHDDDLRVRPTIGLPVPAGATGASYLSPRMKARMHELGLNQADLAAVAGSGAGGRVTIQDFEKFIKSLDDNVTTAASPMRIAVADAMRRSCTRPLATVGRPVTLDPVLVHRRACNPKPGLTLYAIRALALALAEDTAVGGRLVGNRIIHPKSIDIGFAVEVSDGVLVPMIRNVDEKPMPTLVEDYAKLVEQARQRKLPAESQVAGIATVTNFGTFGLVWATPIPLPEQNLVLGLGAGRKRPVWSDEVEAFIPATEAEIALSFDHRILDGGAAGRLLARVAELLQKPEAL
jgi:pyruvate/2-oxoglutarate dehydrogenase complex dihydrolipoamide acyltransferase (E2) component